ncbi:MAG: NADH dehydrogenase subunit [Firmicutes bacterium]|nr:NADH dehydrogenase subunit [Bacillota bacterium]
MVDTSLALGGIEMMAWLALGLECVVMMTLELIPVKGAMSRWILAGGIVLLMILFPVAGVLPHLYERVMYAAPVRVIYQELVLATGLGLTGILSKDGSPVSSTLLMLTLAGGVVAVSANSWLVLFLGIETLNIGLYGLVGHTSRQRTGDEALVKFFILGSVFTAFEVAGIALIGGSQGTLQILASRVPNPALIAGLCLMLAALLFKMGSFPFHLWAPDTYEGSPWQATTVIATLPKIVAGSVIIRLVATGTFVVIPHLKEVLEIVALGTMVIGALGAWRQPRLKRMLAYAAISQVGFVILPLSSGHIGAAGVYLVSYTLGSIAVFSSAQALAGQDNPTRLDLVGALATKSRGAAVALILALAGFAGFPLTVGMAAKLYSVEAVMREPAIIWLGAVLVTGFTFFYYFRWIFPFFAAGDMKIPKAPGFGVLAISQISALLIVVLGIWSYPMIWLTQNLTL